MKLLKNVAGALLVAVCLITTMFTIESDIAITTAFSRTTFLNVQRNLTMLSNAKTMDAQYNFAVMLMNIADKTPKAEHKIELYKEANRMFKKIYTVAPKYWDTEKFINKTQNALGGL